MFINEYKLFDTNSREDCDLRKFSEIIRSTFREIAPEMLVIVGRRRYLVVGEERITRNQAKEISDKLFKCPSFAQWHGYNGKSKRLVKRTNELPMSFSTFKIIYHFYEEIEAV